jgi:hypothetical protein
LKGRSSFSEEEDAKTLLFSWRVEKLVLVAGEGAGCLKDAGAGKRQGNRCSSSDSVS